MGLKVPAELLISWVPSTSFYKANNNCRCSGRERSPGEHSTHVTSLRSLFRHIRWDRTDASQKVQYKHNGLWDTVWTAVLTSTCGPQSPHNVACKSFSKHGLTFCWHKSRNNNWCFQKQVSDSSILWSHVLEDWCHATTTHLKYDFGMIRFLERDISEDTTVFF